MTNNLERTVIVAVIEKGTKREHVDEYLEELTSLALTAGAEVIEQFTQELFRPVGATMIGKGKVQEIKEYVKENNVTLVLFDDDLSPVQLRNLERELEVKVLDRSGIILDIFVKRAKSIEAKTQVELAQMEYLMPRLTRMWTHLSKQFGGIGTKGPGETQIETDRRIIKTRIQVLKEKLKEIEKQREQQRKQRASMPRFALVGYTNAGKSTLMRLITESDQYIEDKLFATLDTTVRQFTLPGGSTALLSDTVGFIRKLPAHLVASFRSTLAEAREADVIIQVVDVSNPYFRDHIRVVEETLDELKIVDKPMILVFNKIDLVNDYYGMKAIEHDYDDLVFISAERGVNITNLLQKFQDVYNENSNEIKILLPYENMEMVALLYKYGEIVSTDEQETGMEYVIRVQHDDIPFIKGKLEKYLVK